MEITRLLIIVHFKSLPAPTHVHLNPCWIEFTKQLYIFFFLGLGKRFRCKTSLIKKVEVVLIALTCQTCLNANSVYIGEKKTKRKKQIHKLINTLHLRAAKLSINKLRY